MDNGGDMFSTCGLRIGLRALDQFRQAGLRAQVSAANVDAKHQVEALHRRGRRGRHADCAGVVDKNVDPAESLHRLRQRGLNARLFANVALHRQRPAARSLDLLRRAVDSAGQLGIGPGRLGRDHDVGAVGGGTQRNCQADAARRIGDEESPALEVHVFASWIA